MAYQKTTWVNNAPPAINATNLNNIEDGIEDNENAIADVDSKIGDLTDLHTADQSSVVNAINELLVPLGVSTNGPAVKTGRQVDGKDEYVKRFRAAISNGLQIPHGVTNFKLTKAAAFVDNTYDGAYRPLPMSTGTTYYSYQITDTNIEYYQSFALTGNIEVEMYYILND